MVIELLKSYSSGVCPAAVFSNLTEDLASVINSADNELPAAGG